MQTLLPIAGVVTVTTIAAAGAVLCDDFDDDAIDDRWLVLEPEPTIIRVVEQNMRLELPANENPGAEAGAGVISADWALDANADFQLRIAAHRDIPPVAGGDIGLEFILAFNVDIEAEDLQDGVSAYVGRNEDGPYLGLEVTRGGVAVQNESNPFPPTDVTLYVWYDATADTLFLSPVAYFDGDATPVFGMRASSGSDRIRLIISAFTEGPAPAVAGEDHFFDDFCIDVGVIVPLCPADIDGNGTVDVADLVLLLSAWGPCPGCPEDIDGDDVVDVADLVAVLSAWGECE